MNEDEKIKVYNAGFADGQKHKEPAEETRKFMEESIKDRAVLNEKLDNLITYNKEFHAENKESHEVILEQVKKTNGSVADIQQWRERITGGAAVVSVIIIPTVMFLFYQYLTNR
jgi:hypothetical protein